MICRYCQNPIRTNFPYPSNSKAICCRVCREFLFGKNGFTWYKENGEIVVLWNSFTDVAGNDFRIYFRYDKNKTDFTRVINGKEEIVLSFGYVMPITEDYIRKTKAKLKIWQVFS